MSECNVSIYMAYFIIHKRSRSGAVIGMSWMDWPNPGLVGGMCKLMVTVNKEEHTFTLRRNRNTGIPIDWQDIYFAREITKAEYESYLEMKVFKGLKSGWFERFKKRCK